MDLPYLHCESDSTDHALLNSLPPETEDDDIDDEWTFAEVKLFENALVEFEGTASPAFFQYVSDRMPWKSTESVKLHYEALMEDIEMMQSSTVYFQGDQGKMEGDQAATKQKKKKAIPWTEEEHKLFLIGLDKFGEGNWKRISKDCVLTKTPVQVASHAQKFNRRKTCKTPREKRRQSIHDITSVDSTPGHEQTISGPKATDNVMEELPRLPALVDSDQTTYYNNFNDSVGGTESYPSSNTAFNIGNLGTNQMTAKPWTKERYYWG